MPAMPNERWWVVTVHDNNPDLVLRITTTLRRFGTESAIQNEIKQGGRWVFISIREETPFD
jgi:hypothetical protein